MELTTQKWGGGGGEECNFTIFDISKLNSSEYSSDIVFRR